MRYEWGVAVAVVRPDQSLMVGKSAREAHTRQTRASTIFAFANGRGMAVTIEEIAVGVKGTLAEMFLASEVTDNKRVV